jgi:peptidyl-prolyl cis-trans isomerase B (cyclophilin B)
MGVVLLGSALLAGSLPAAAQPKPVKETRKFTPKEIKQMAETRAVIETPFGKITLRFFPEVAPHHVQSFLKLSREGLYNGTTFHRVIPGFMIQGGDPNSRNPNRSLHGTGGPGYSLKAEFNDRPHKRGTLSMARAADPHSAGSQFFICVAPAPFLDRQYTAFGEVVEGMEAVDKIVAAPRDPRDNPLERVEMTVKVLEPAASAPGGGKGQ